MGYGCRLQVHESVADILVQVTALVGSGLFIGVRIAIVRTRTGPPRGCASGEGMEVTRNGGEKQDVVIVI